MLKTCLFFKNIMVGINHLIGGADLNWVVATWDGKYIAILEGFFLIAGVGNTKLAYKGLTH